MTSAAGFDLPLGGPPLDFDPQTYRAQLATARVRFTSIGAAIGHHGVGRLLWKAGPPNGPVAVTGMDIAHFKDGRIQALYVFLDPATA
jgi:hypothetical protein